MESIKLLKICWNIKIATKLNQENTAIGKSPSSHNPLPPKKKLYVVTGQEGKTGSIIKFSSEIRIINLMMKRGKNCLINDILWNLSYTGEKYIWVYFKIIEEYI